jgi:hypothetical protein
MWRPDSAVVYGALKFSVQLMVGLACLIRVVFTRLLLLFLLYKKKNKQKKVVSPVMAFGIDNGGNYEDAL